MRKLSLQRQTLRWCSLCLQLLRALWIVVRHYPSYTLEQQHAASQHWCQQTLQALGVQLQAQRPAVTDSTQGGQLLVANHISWLDVLVLNAYCPTDFVAKAEVQYWPVLGCLAKRNGTLFLPRHSPSQAQAMTELVAARLQAGHSVLVFPEGSTSPGAGVLPFYPALFQAAVDAACPVQPLALSYRHATGEASRAAVYAGDTTLGQSLRRIMATPDLCAHISVCPTIAYAPAHRRRHLARITHAAIAAQMQQPIVVTAASAALATGTSGRQPSSTESAALLVH